MRSRDLVVGVSFGTIAMVALFAASGAAQTGPTGPKARYWMDAETRSGLGAAGGNPMAMMMRGGGGVVHALDLRLGSQLTPTGGAPSADHFMPPVARLGASVPLATPVADPPGDGAPGAMERPRGRLRIFWGCGPKAGPGQPVVIDFARVAAGQFPPGLFSTSVPSEHGPLKSNSRTFGSWPNDKARKTLDGNSSLLGPHRIAGNYSPEIKFSLAQDFMPPLRANGADGPGGTVQLAWQGVAGATGYYAFAMGARDGGRDADMVWWTSASTQQFGAGLSGWLAPATVARLIGQKVVMPPQQTSCTIPAEVKAASGEGMMAFLTAFGPEVDFAFPPRPADPKKPWIIEWTAKARFKSSTMIVPGMDMDAMRGASDDQAQQDEEPANPEAKPKKKCKRGGLGGVIGGALGGLAGKDC